MLRKNRQPNHARNATSQENDYISQTIIGMKLKFEPLETRLKNLQLSLEGLLSRNELKSIKIGIQHTVWQNLNYGNSNFRFHALFPLPYHA